MSLILEALKKSEAERRLGETPGLSTLPVWKPRARASRAWWLLIPAVAIAAAAYWSNRDLLSDAPAPEADAVAASGVHKADQALLEGDGAASVPVKQSTALTQEPSPPQISEPRPSPQVAVAPAAVAPMPEPQPMPQSMDDLEAMKGISPENQQRIRSGELFVPSPSLLAERGPTTEEPIITAESALPPPLPEPGMEAAGMSPAPADSAAPDASTASQAQVAAVPEPVVTVAAPANVPAESAPAVSAHPERESVSSHPGVLDFYDLTLNQRQGLPALKMSMHVYHRDVARRFVIIDGKRLNEDGVMGQQLWAREILPDGVIIEYNDIRFFLPRLGG